MLLLLRAFSRDRVQALASLGRVWGCGVQGSGFRIWGFRGLGIIGLQDTGARNPPKNRLQPELIA